ncbi:unnamed protein product [Rotaria sordida]|uniref:Uncharacterized protein n=1 Tax=Rotaria sordida TaxID=392033 RepID=A0A819D470_9BILA|nr:unnamed protein product [Rotaria sordida]
MDYDYNDDHYEDDLPVLSLPTAPSKNKTSNNSYEQDNTGNDRTSSLLQNWKILYDTSLRSLQSDDAYQTSVPITPSYFGRQPSIERPTIGRSYTSTYQSQVISNTPIYESQIISNTPTYQSQVITNIPTYQSQVISNIPTYQSQVISNTPIYESQIISNTPIYQSQVISNTPKSKWEVRLPQLLNGTVGPDRQKRDIIRRHTTNIVFQGSNSNMNGFNSYLSSQVSNETVNDRPITPLVKQIRQNFDRMKVNDTLPASPRNRRQFPFDNSSNIRRVASLNYQREAANSRERLNQQPRAMLPIRSTTEITTLNSRSASTEELNNRMPINNSRIQRNKISPPVSYPKYSYPPLPTKSVVKQLIGGGATLVYDSISESGPSRKKPAVIKHQKNIQQITHTLTNTNSTLSGRQLRSDASDSPSATPRKNKTNKQKLIKSKEDETPESYYEAVSLQGSTDLSDNNDVQGSNEPVDHDNNTNENEAENYYPAFDVD